MNKISQTLERKQAELQSQVLEIRMVPIGQIFSRLGAGYKEIFKEIEKRIEFGYVFMSNN